MVIYKINYTNESLVLIESAVAYYTKEDLELGKRFEFELRNCIYQIKNNPKMFSKNKENHRRAILGSSFPYSVYYQINEKEKTIEIYAVLHQSRNIDFNELEKELDFLQNKRLQKNRLMELNQIQKEKNQSKDQELER